MTKEKLYVITYEHKIEPLYSRTSVFSVGIDYKDAEKRFLNEDPQGADLLILETVEFKIPGYNINLEKIIETPT